MADADFKNILVIRIRAFGDTILTTPLLRNLKKQYPKAQLSILVDPPMSMIVQDLPYVDRIIPFDRKASKENGKLGELAANLRFYAWLKKQKFDLVLDVLGTPRTAWMALATSAPRRLGFAFRVRKWVYSDVHKPSKTVRYMADYNCDLLRLLGHEPDNLDLDFVVPSWAKDSAAKFIESKNLKGKRLLGIAPAGGWALKRYPPEKMRVAATMICKKTGLVPFILWGPGEEPLARQTAEGMHPGAVMAPPTDFARMGALLKHCEMLLTNDGATKHLAVALKVPSLTIFGPTNFLAWHPPHDKRHAVVQRGDLDCQPCDALHACPIKTHECLLALRPEEVASVAAGLIAAGRPRRA